MKPVTLVAIDTIEHELVRLAIEKCQRHFEFADIIIYSDREIPIRGARHIPSKVANIYEAGMLAWTGPAQHVTTSHYLLVQYDSWIINPQLWTDEFLQYDYIGAPWHWEDWAVGNGGFCLRSLKFARAVINGKFAWRFPEDVWLSRQYRPRLEQRYGLRWAPPQLALRFSVENSTDLTRSWGFHGPFCMRYLLADEWPLYTALSSGHLRHTHEVAINQAERMLQVTA